MKFNVKLSGFEGPLDLLLDLIEVQKLSISVVSLSAVTDEYIKHMRKLTDFPRAEAADFLVVASTLMLIKSRSLLPTLELTKEETEGIYDLETRLKLLQRLRELGLNIKEAWGLNQMFSREAFKGMDFGFIEPIGVSIGSLNLSLKNLVAGFPKLKELPSKTLEKVISIEEKMVELIRRLSERLKASFKDVVGAKNKTEVIIGFLALLELVKEGALLVSQEERFGNIELEKTN